MLSEKEEKVQWTNEHHEVSETKITCCRMSQTLHVFLTNQIEEEYANAAKVVVRA
jgi:hypothetical protein